MQAKADATAHTATVERLRQQVADAQASACATQEQFTAWRQVQADLIHKLPAGQEAVSLTGRTSDGVGGLVPKQDLLRLQEGTPSPVAAFRRAEGVRKENPLEIFREVHRGGGKSKRPSAGSAVLAAYTANDSESGPSMEQRQVERALASTKERLQAALQVSGTTVNMIGVREHANCDRSMLAPLHCLSRGQHMQGIAHSRPERCSVCRPQRKLQT